MFQLYVVNSSWTEPKRCQFQDMFILAPECSWQNTFHFVAKFCHIFDDFINW